MIQLTTSGSTIVLQADAISQLQMAFRERQSVRLPGLLGADLLALIGPRLERASFAEASYHDVGTDLMMQDETVLRALHFAVNDPSFLALVQAITGCEPLGCYLGRVYRMLPGAGHAEDWHDDIAASRQIGMSVNLSPRPFDGGLFELRTVGATAALARVHNTGPGDAVLFRIANTLQHRVTEVTGTEPKTAFAGWFRTEPNYWDPLLEP